MTPAADPQTLEAVRPVVRDMLLGVPAFRQLSPEEQQSIAKATVKVASYLANPEGMVTAAGKAPVARAQANEDPVTATQRRLSEAPGQVGKGFEAGAVREGVEQFGALVQKVDFPKFVGGLIQNVFQAIVDSSIQQMRAYGELVSNVAKTVEEFASDNISENNSRDWLAGKYSDAFEVNIDSGSSGMAEGSDATPQPVAKLQTKDGVTDERLAAISKEVGLDKPITDLSNEEDEAKLVQSARLQMARGRQQLLASMVIMGINRIVVTDGLIQAKVIFDMRASDTASRQARASMMDKKKDASKTTSSISAGGWLSPVDASYTNENSSEHIATVQSSVDDQSESKAEVKAKLTGEVRVNFKSDYFPMEKMASPQMIAAIQGNSKPPDKAIGGA
jgi:hypothetical protein